MRSLMSRRGNGIVFREKDGAEGRGDVVSLTRESLVFEIYSPRFDINRGQAIPELTIYRGGKAIYTGGAAVSGILSSGRVLTVSATPLGAWAPVVDIKPGDAARALVHGWETGHELVPSYELAVTKLRSFLLDLSRWVASVDLTQVTSEAEAQLAIVEDWCDAVHPRLRQLFDAFEAAALEVPPEQWDAHRVFTQEELHPLTLCAPFVHRTYTKPLGYAGDYEMVNMILRNRPEGPSIFAGIVNAYFLRINVAQGHRNRIDRLADTLNVEAKRVASSGRPFRVLNLGCGPAVEISRFVRDSSLSERCEFTLLDFNKETIEFADQQIRHAMVESGRSPTIVCVQQSVNELLKDATRGGTGGAGGGFDFVYCAGLFDYLSDRVCSRLLESMYRKVAPGGLIAATNVHPGHGSQAALDTLGEWRLILRTESDMQRLAVSIPVPSSASTEPAGTNVFLELRKPVTADDRGVKTSRWHAAL